MKKIAEEEAKKTFGDKTSQSILDEFNKSQVKTGMALVVPEKIEEDEVNTESVVENQVKIKTFLSIPHHQEWNRVLIWDVLVTDDSGHRYDTTYNEYVGNALSDVKVSGTIKNPSDTIIQSFNGTTDRSGKYLGTFLIPDQSTTRGEYVISVDVVKTLDDNTDATSSNSGGFSVFPISGSTNQAPNASAGPDQHLASGSLATLSGSGSSDSDSAVIFYTWSQTSGTSVTLSSNTAENPTFTVPDESGTFVFSLSADDGQKTSNADSISITSLHSNAGPDQAVGVALVTLDGSGSGDALGHAFTFSWSVTSVPGGSAVNTASLSDTSAVGPTFTPDVTGVYNLQLVVDDGIVPSDTDTVTITVT